MTSISNIDLEKDVFHLYDDLESMNRMKRFAGDSFAPFEIKTVLEIMAVGDTVYSHGFLKNENKMITYNNYDSADIKECSPFDIAETAKEFYVQDLITSYEEDDFANYYEERPTLNEVKDILKGHLFRDESFSREFDFSEIYHVRDYVLYRHFENKEAELKGIDNSSNDKEGFKKLAEGFCLACDVSPYALNFNHQIKTMTEILLKGGIDSAKQYIEKDMPLARLNEALDGAVSKAFNQQLEKVINAALTRENVVR